MDEVFARSLMVRPGQTVWALLHWTVVEADEEEWANDCAPDPAALLVIPPDETTQLSNRPKAV